jgi:hypothetical protein
MSYVAEKLAADSVCIHHHLHSAVNYEAVSSRIIDNGPSIDYTGNHSFTHGSLPTEYNASRLQSLLHCYYFKCPRELSAFPFITPDFRVDYNITYLQNGLTLSVEARGDL